jgi:hypothetical protein
MNTQIGAFDATSYRQRVLATLRSASSLDLSDPFFIVDLPVDVDDTELIRGRIIALVGFWNKERSPNYKALTAELAALVRMRIGPIAALRTIDVVPGLPKTRSGKILRKTMRGIANGKDEPVPSTIDDPAVLAGLRPILLRRNDPG